MSAGGANAGVLAAAWVGAEGLNPAFRAEWDRLVESDAEASVFQTLEWIEPWWRWVGGGRLRLLTIRRLGRLVAAAPLVEKLEVHAGLRARMLVFAGEPLADRMGVLHDPADPGALRAVVTEILKAARRVDVVRLAEIEEGSPSELALQEAIAASSMRATQRRCSVAPVRTLEGPLEAIEAAYSRSLKLRLRRARAKHRGAGGLDFRRWTPRVEDVPALIEEFARVENLSWKGAEGVGIFSTPQRRKFFEEVSSRLAARGWLDVATLRLGARLAAYRFGFRFRGAFLDYNLAHDPALDALSPGRVLLDEIVRDSHALGLRAVDASRGRLDHPHMLGEWSASRRFQRRWLLYGDSWRAASLFMLESRVRPAGRWVRGKLASARRGRSEPAVAGGPDSAPSRESQPAAAVTERAPARSRGGAWSLLLLVPRVATVVASLGLGMAIASASSVLAAVIAAGAVGLVLVLYAPALALLGALAAGPTLGAWLDIVIAGVPAITVDRCLLLVACAAAGVQWWLGRSRGGVGAITWCMAVFLLIAAISAVTGGGTRRSSTEGGLRNDLVFLILGYGVPFAGFVLARTLLVRTVHVRWVLRVLVGVGVIVSCVGILQLFLGVTLFEPSRMTVIHAGRATGTLTSAVEFGLVIGAAMITAIVMLMRAGPPWRSGALLAAIVLMAAASLASRTRAPWLGIAAGLAVVAYFEPRLRRPLGAVAAVAGASIAIAWPVLAPSEFVSQRVFDMTPVYNRITLTATALNMFVHNPVLGLGFGRYTFDAEKWRYLVSVGDVSPHYAYSLSVPHNEVLHVLVLLGVIGAVPYVMIYALGWRTAARECRALRAAGPEGELALVCLGVLSMYIVSAQFSDCMFYFYASFQVLVVMGVVDGWRARRLAAGGEGPG